MCEAEFQKCADRVEQEMYSFFGDTGPRYKNKYRSLMFNLKDPRNKARLKIMFLEINGPALLIISMYNQMVTSEIR